MRPGGSNADSWLTRLEMRPNMIQMIGVLLRWMDEFIYLWWKLMGLFWISGQASCLLKYFHQTKQKKTSADRAVPACLPFTNAWNEKRRCRCQVPKIFHFLHFNQFHFQYFVHATVS